jgi:hypothetical protein
VQYRQFITLARCILSEFFKLQSLIKKQEQATNCSVQLQFVLQELLAQPGQQSKTET